MAADFGNVFHFFIPLLLCLIGFQGIWFYSEPWKKTVSWCAFQAGLAVFLLQLTNHENPFPLALALVILTSTAATGLLLAVFCAKLGSHPKSSEGGKSARRSSK